MFEGTSFPEHQLKTMKKLNTNIGQKAAAASWAGVPGIKWPWTCSFGCLWFVLTNRRFPEICMMITLWRQPRNPLLQSDKFSLMVSDGFPTNTTLYLKNQQKSTAMAKRIVTEMSFKKQSCFLNDISVTIQFLSTLSAVCKMSNILFRCVMDTQHDWSPSGAGTGIFREV